MRRTSVSARRTSLTDPQVTVLTPTIPERAAFLQEASLSVQAQTLKDTGHLVYVDLERQGLSKTVNRMVQEVRSPWLLILADDDLLLPRCLEHLLSVADGAHVVYSPPLVWGEPAAPFQGEHPNIPSCALISTRAWRDLGGYNERLREQEDNDLWQRMVKAGAVFRRYADQPTWIYRFHGCNKSRGRRD